MCGEGDGRPHTRSQEEEVREKGGENNRNRREWERGHCHCIIYTGITARHERWSSLRQDKTGGTCMCEKYNAVVQRESVL